MFELLTSFIALMELFFLHSSSGRLSPTLALSLCQFLALYCFKIYLASFLRYKTLFLPLTLQPLYNKIRYNRVLDVTRSKDGSQKCIDYIEK